VISDLHCYVNSRPDVDWNTCGQAAIATMADYWGKDPWDLDRVERDPDDGRWYWDDGAAIDAVKADGFDSDVVFGWGSTGDRIKQALKHYGLSASVGYSGFASWGWQDRWESVQKYVAKNRPVPVMLDLGAIGGPSWTAHWAICYHVEDGEVHLGNCSWNPSPRTDDFLDAWRAWFLPYGFNHCAVFC